MTSQSAGLAVEAPAADGRLQAFRAFGVGYLTYQVSWVLMRRPSPEWSVLEISVALAAVAVPAVGFSAVHFLRISGQQMRLTVVVAVVAAAAGLGVTLLLSPLVALAVPFAGSPLGWAAIAALPIRRKWPAWAKWCAPLAGIAFYLIFAIIIFPRLRSGAFDYEQYALTDICIVPMLAASAFACYRLAVAWEEG